MSIFNYKENPQYPDRFTTDSNWKRVLPIHGRPLQAAELTEMQSISHANLTQIADTLFVNGTVVQGLRLSLVSQANNTLTIAVTSGRFYVEGMMVEIPSTTIQVNSVGSYDIGVLPKGSITTEEEDPTLRDPVKGGARYGLPGASRLVISTTIEVNNPQAYTIARVVDGAIIQREGNTFTKIDNALAKYTYERSGNFCIAGLDVTCIDSTNSEIADKKKYQNLEAAVTTSQDELQTALTTAQGQQDVVNNLRVQLTNATESVRLSPTNRNKSILASIQSQLTQAEATLDKLSRVVFNKTTQVRTNTSNLTSATNLLADKTNFSISAGVAYVNGYRVSLNNDAVISIPKNLDIVEVTGASFTYSGSVGSTRRVFSLASGATFSNIKSQYTTLEFIFNKLTYNNTFVQVNVVVKLFNLASNSTPELLDYLMAEFNKLPTTSWDSNIVISSPSNLDTLTLRSILRSNLVISKETASSLLLQSTSVQEIANQISVDVSVKRNAENGVYIEPSSVLLVDVGNSNLAGAGRFNSFQLGFRPVDEILEVSAEVEESTKPVVRGTAPGTLDNLGDDSVVRITRVIQGDTTYTEGLDYTLINQSQISWSGNNLGSKEPDPGTTYYVSFIYTQALALDKDYTWNRTTDAIEFTGTTPAVGGRILVDYTYFLSRAGVLYLTSAGEVKYLLSESSSNPIPPGVGEEYLPIATFKLFQGGGEVQSTNCKAVSFAAMREYITTVNKNTLDLERYALDTTGYKLASAASSNTQIGLYTDNLLDLSKIDLGKSTAAITPATGSITNSYTHKDIALKATSSQKYCRLGQDYFITLKPESLNANFLEQTRRTGTQVIPTNTSLKGKGMLHIPRVSFMNQGFGKLNPCDELARNSSLLARLGKDRPLFYSISNYVKNQFRSIANLISSSFRSLVPATNTAGDNSFAEYAISSVLASNRTMPLKITGLASSSDGWQLFFNNKLIKDVTLKGATSLSASILDAVKASSSGVVELEFTIPFGTKPGMHLVELVSTTGYASGTVTIFNNLLHHTILSGSSNWDTFGSSTRLQEMPLIIKGSHEGVLSTTASNVITLPTLYEPLNQTFEVAQETVLSRVGLLLANVDVGGVVNVSIRDVAQDKPLYQVYSLGSATTYQFNDYTYFDLDYPVYLLPGRKYCLSLSATTPNFKLYSSQVSVLDINNQTIVGNQLFLKGELILANDFLSLNKLENTDLTFKLQQATYPTTPEVISLGVYGTSDNFPNISSFCLNLRELVPTGCAIEYEYRLDKDSTTWVKIISNLIICLGEFTNYLELRAKLVSSNSKLTPYLFTQGASVSLYSASKDAEQFIISKQVEYSRPYKNAHVVIRTIIPTGSEVNAYYSPTSGNILEGAEWIGLTKLKEVVIDQGIGMKEITYAITHPSDTIGSNIPRTKFRWRLGLKSTTVNSPMIKNIISYVW